LSAIQFPPHHRDRFYAAIGGSAMKNAGYLILQRNEKADCRSTLKLERSAAPTTNPAEAYSANPLRAIVPDLFAKNPWFVSTNFLAT
jgi:predicted component of type VI protein secretion system